MGQELWPSSSLTAWQQEPKGAFLDWLAAQRNDAGAQLRETSCDTYTAMFSAWLNFLQSRNLSVLEACPQDAAVFFQEAHTARRTALLLPVSRRRYLQLLDRVYAHLRGLGLSPGNPLREELARERELEPSLPAGLSEPELERLVQALLTLAGWKGARDRAMAALLLGAGLRVNELVRMTVPELSTEGEFPIQVRPTGVHCPHQTLVLPDGPWRGWLIAWARVREAALIPGRILCPATKSGNAFSASGIFRRTALWLSLTGGRFEQHGPNLLRNTFAQSALKCGRYSLSEVQEFLGHQQQRATAKHQACVQAGA